MSVRRRVDHLAAAKACDRCGGTGVATPAPVTRTAGGPKPGDLRAKLLASIADVKSRLPDDRDDEGRVVAALTRLDPATSPRALAASKRFVARLNGHGSHDGAT